MAFLDYPDLVLIAPVPRTLRILGGQDLDLGYEPKAYHNVRLIIASSAPSGAPPPEHYFQKKSASQLVYILVYRY